MTEDEGSPVPPSRKEEETGFLQGDTAAQRTRTEQISSKEPGATRQSLEPLRPAFRAHLSLLEQVLWDGVGTSVFLKQIY